MQPVAKANTYHAVIRSQERLAAGKTNLKVYFIDIVGRKDPSRTEWDKCGIDRRQFLDRLAKTEGVEGVGFVTAFPHITKAFRFGRIHERGVQDRLRRSQAREKCRLRSTVRLESSRISVVSSTV